MKKSILIGFIISLVLFMNAIPERSGNDSTTSSAVEVTLLGPKQYVRTNGAPNIFTDSFPGRVGQGKIIISNGRVDGTKAISSAIIKINGNQIFGTSDFNQNVLAMERLVSLQEKNSISVELRSKPGNYLTIEINEEIIAEAELVVGAAGGIIKVDNPLSPIYGTKVEIPQGSLAEETKISIFLSPVSPTISGPGLIQNMPAITFLSSVQNLQFNKSVKITIPIKNFDIYAPELPLVEYFNEETQEWEYVPAFLDFIDKAVIFESDHFSIYTVINLLLDPSIFGKLVEETAAYIRLIGLAEKVAISGIECSELDAFKAEFTNIAEVSHDIMIRICENSLSCLGGKTPKEFMNFLGKKTVDALKMQILKVGSLEFLKAVLGASQAGGAILVVKVCTSIGAVLAFAETLCLVGTSQYGPDFVLANASRHFAIYGLTIASMVSANMGCPGGIFSDNFEDGDVNGWYITDAVVTATTENKMNGNYSMKLYDNSTSPKGTGVQLTFDTESSRIGIEFYEWTNNFGWSGGSEYYIDTARPIDPTHGWRFAFAAQAYTNNRWKYVDSQSQLIWTTGNPWSYLARDFPTPVSAQTYGWHKIKVEIFGPEGRARFWYDDQFKGEIEITPTTSPLKYFWHNISWSTPIGTISYIDDFKVYEIPAYY